jgi:hypothetical protein
MAGATYAVRLARMAEQSALYNILKQLLKENDDYCDVTVSYDSTHVRETFGFPLKLSSVIEFAERINVWYPLGVAFFDVTIVKDCGSRILWRDSGVVPRVVRANAKRSAKKTRRRHNNAFLDHLPM